ncbi:hypothetical protein [Janthinobacterium lividum]|uniref:hypothetical protein n=1 Tax=Janthinobacterium lividum TaxID=29581 RepID=UPI000A5DE986|nr:hypothetical protein [Janthinobacterium lividum]
MNTVMPNGLAPIVSQYSLAGPGGVMRTEVAGGAPRYGLDWDRGSQQFNVTLMLDALRFSVWTAFYHHIIKKGAITFDMELDSGFGCAAHACNIVPGSYSATRTAGTLIAVSFVVDAESQAYEMTGDDAQAMVDLYNQYGKRTNDLLDRLAQFANVDTNVLDF